MTSVATQSPMTTRWPLSDARFRLGERSRADCPTRPARDAAQAGPVVGPYRDLTGTQLRELLDAEGVRTTNTANVRELDPADLHAAAELGF